MLALLKGLFFTSVLNDPLVSYTLRAYMSYVDASRRVNRELPTEMLNAYQQILEIQAEWRNYQPSLSQFVTLMLETGVYERYTAKDEGGVKAVKLEWNKPLWFEIFKLHINQACGFQTDEQASLNDEMFGVKSYFKSTQLQM